MAQFTVDNIQPHLQQHGIQVQGSIPTSFFATRHNPYRWIG